MGLSPIACPAWETIRGVQFAMLDGSTLVTVVVTSAALGKIQRIVPGVGGHLACFTKHRETIEEVANAKHQRGQIDEEIHALRTWSGAPTGHQVLTHC